MGRIDTTNVLATKMGGGHMESVIGKATTGATADETIQNGYVGTIGALIRNNIYEFLPLVEGDKLYVIATPEVNAKDDSITDRVIKTFVLANGEVCDAVPLVKADKISLSEDLIEVAGGDTLEETGYVYTKAGERKFQYKATLPTLADDGALHIAKIESITNATQGIVVGLNDTALQLNYKMIKVRF